MTLKYEKNKVHIKKYVAANPAVIKRIRDNFVANHPEYREKQRLYMKEYRLRKKLKECSTEE
jgi:hypothetical protein